MFFVSIMSEENVLLVYPDRPSIPRGTRGDAVESSDRKAIRFFYAFELLIIRQK
jgi:hypothetical protein